MKNTNFTFVIKMLAFAAFLVCCSFSGWGQISITNLGTALTENFNSLSSSGLVLLCLQDGLFMKLVQMPIHYIMLVPVAVLLVIRIVWVQPVLPTELSADYYQVVLFRQ